MRWQFERKVCLYCWEWKFPWDVKRSEYPGQLRCRKCGKLGITTRHYWVYEPKEFLGLFKRDPSYKEKLRRVQK